MSVAESCHRTDPNFWRNLLRRYRFTSNLKQAALAYDLGVTQAMVSRWESGAARPATDMQEKIRALTGAPDDMSAPLVGWRNHVAFQPGMAAVITRDGVIETASAGLAREAGLSRNEVEGRALGDLFRGDLVALLNTLNAKGFFDGALENVESADRYCFVNSHGKRDIGPVHGLHWPHLAENGTVWWMLTGARVGIDEFDLLRTELGGQIALSERG